MNLRTKISVALILSLGALYQPPPPCSLGPALITSPSGSIATIVRIPYIYRLAQISAFLYVNTNVAIWSTVERGLGITAAVMACLQPLVQTFLSGSRLLGSLKSAMPTAATCRRAGYLRSWGDEEPQGSRRTPKRNGRLVGEDADGGSIGMDGGSKDAARDSREVLEREGIVLTI